MNKEILSKVDEIVSYIKSTKEYNEYLKAIELLKDDKDLNLIIDDIKKCQREIVKNPSKKRELDLKIQKDLDFLNNSPLYNEYENLQNEINNMLIIFENKINKYFEDVFN